MENMMVVEAMLKLGGPGIVQPSCKKIEWGGYTAMGSDV